MSIENNRYCAVCDNVIDSMQLLSLFYLTACKVRSSTYAWYEAQILPAPRLSNTLLDITESGGELGADLSIVDVDSERLRSVCFVVLL